MSDADQVAPLPPHLRKRRLRRREVAEYLAQAHGITIAAQTLAKWATAGSGPAFSRLNRSALYLRTDIDAWVQSALKPAAPANSGDQ